MKPYGFIAAIMIVLLVSFYLTPFGHSGDRGSQARNDSEIDATLKSIAAQLNSNLPVMVDPMTRLDSAQAGDKRFHYNYTLVDYSADDPEAEAIVAELQPSVEWTTCNEDDMRVFFMHGVSTVYSYHGNDGDLIKSITITPADCGY